MKKHNIKYLLFSLLFITLSITLLVYEAINVTSTLKMAYRLGTVDNLIDTFFVGLSMLLNFMVAALAVMFAVGSIPFTATLIKRREGKKWFTVLLLVMAIILIVLPILTYLSMSVITSINPPSSTSSTSSATTTSYNY